MRVEILTLNFSIKDGLKIVSKTKMKNCWSTLCINYTVNLESIKTAHNKIIYIYIYIYIYKCQILCRANKCHSEG